jgi:hypothetical protein
VEVPSYLDPAKPFPTFSTSLACAYRDLSLPELGAAQIALDVRIPIAFAY